MLERINAMFDKTDKQLSSSQAQYKKTYDKKVRQVKTFEPGTYVFVDRPKTEQKSAQENQSNAAKSKLLSRGLGPFLVLRSFETVAIIQDGTVEVPVSVDRLTLAPSPRLPASNPNANVRIPQSTPTTPTNDTQDISTIPDPPMNDVRPPPEPLYISRIVDHIKH